MPALAEEIDAVRDIILAKETGAHIHIAHVSTKSAIEAVRRAKNEGINVTCEVTPHHFTLTDRRSKATIRTQKWRRRCGPRNISKRFSKGIKDGTIDAIATDHAPHHADEKALEYDRAPFGITGLETAVGLAFNELVNKGIIDLARLVELCSTNPAKIFQLDGRGTLKPGSKADMTILDPRTFLDVQQRRFAFEIEKLTFQRPRVSGRRGRQRSSAVKSCTKSAKRGQILKSLSDIFVGRKFILWNGYLIHRPMDRVS